MGNGGMGGGNILSVRVCERDLRVAGEDESSFDQTRPDRSDKLGTFFHPWVGMTCLARPIRKLGHGDAFYRTAHFILF